MLKNFNRNFIVFRNPDVAIKFVQNSAIGKRIPLESFSTENKVTCLVYSTWDEITPDEMRDVVFYPDVICSSFNVAFTDYGKTQE